MYDRLHNEGELLHAIDDDAVVVCGKATVAV